VFHVLLLLRKHFEQSHPKAKKAQHPSQTIAPDGKAKREWKGLGLPERAVVENDETTYPLGCRVLPCTLS